MSNWLLDKKMELDALEQLNAQKKELEKLEQSLRTSIAEKELKAYCSAITESLVGTTDKNGDRFEIKYERFDPYVYFTLKTAKNNIVTIRFSCGVDNVLVREYRCDGWTFAPLNELRVAKAILKHVYVQTPNSK